MSANRDFDKAIADYNQAVALVPTTFAFTYRGNAWQAKGNFKQAILDYEEAIALDANNADAYRNCGSAWLGGANATRRLPTSPKPFGLIRRT